ncbi:MAG: MbnP family protein [Reichenbachiella sp.]|uniref:MbnP family protein n=1 Tax=Reichenbachiella sp. TaxID=2184521 RepID=UPI003265A235
MMKRFQILSNLSMCLLVALLLSTCSDEDSTVRTLTLNFKAQIDGELVEFEARKYQSPAHQSVSFDRLKVYISNIELVDVEAGEVFTEVDSYHLLSFDADTDSAFFEIRNIPQTFNVDEIRFGVGVDEEANASIDHVGDLDPTNSMAWDWNTGYKFLLLEGRYYPSGDDLGEEIKMHIGTNANYANNLIGFQESISVEENPTHTLYVNALVPFGTIDLSEGTVFMNDERGNEVARNYMDGFISTF